MALQVRKELRRQLRRLDDEIQVTSIFVTHDQEEALEVTDRAVLMSVGRVEQQDALELELEREGQAGLIEAEIPADRDRALKLCEGEILFARPRRLFFFELERCPLWAPIGG